MAGKSVWVGSRLQELKELAEQHTISQIAQHYHLSTQAIREACEKNGITLIRSDRFWNDEKLAVLQEKVVNLTPTEAAAVLNIPVGTLYSLRTRRGLRFKDTYHNTDADFHTKYTKNEITGCWEWNKPAASKGGYGQFHIAGKSYMAHRYSWELHTGKKIPEGYQVDHLCVNPACVNPAHLEPVTVNENVLRITRRYALMRQIAWQVVDTPSEENLEKLRMVLTT